MKNGDKTIEQLITELEGLEARHRHAEEVLKSSETRYRRLFETAQDGILILDADTGQIDDVNPFLMDMLAYTYHEFLGKKLWEIGAFRDVEASKAAFNELQQKGYVRYEDLPLRTKDGRKIAVEFVSNVYLVNHKKVIQCNIRDITDRKRMVAELLKIRNLESIGTLAGGIAHDFNNLLMAVTGYISLAKMQLSSGDGAYKLLAEAERVSLTGKELTQTLITFSKGGAPTKKVMTLNQLIRDNASAVLADSIIRCDYAFSDDPGPVLADERHIRQVIHNIVVNAKEAMPRGGVIKIGAANVTLAAGDTIPLPTGDYVKVSIEDQGIGIEEENLPKIFDPYFTAKGMGSDKGMGLGLAVAFSIVQRHNGHIAVESIPDKGTTVNIYLPVYREETEITNNHKEAARRSHGRILFMDDEEAVREIGGQFISHMGYEVVLAGNGDEAMTLYKDALNSGKSFDAVILDLTVKVGIGGKEVMGELLSLDPNVKAIISSGYTDDPAISRYGDWGFKGAITKPYGIEQLKGILQRIGLGENKETP
jgi:two-component system cell cycle sensor histidine kinase/response regulator CckA